MRVISGTLKGKNIEGYNISGTRPTMDRVKESVFSTIQDSIKNSVVLDLFAGSGQLGIEAISNGSKLCYFIDNNKEATNTIKKNIELLNIKDKSIVLNYDYKKSLNYFKDNNIKFNIIFVDPPYDYDVLDKVISKILEYNLLEKKGILVIEHTKEIKGDYKDLYLYKAKKYGYKYIIVYFFIILINNSILPYYFYNSQLSKYNI